MVRFYLVPSVVDASGVRGPAFFQWPGPHDPPVVLFTGVSFDIRFYGASPTMVLAADMTDANDATLSAQSGVVKFADNLDAQVGATALSGLQSALEADNLPAGMVNAGTLWRQVLRGIIGIFGITEYMSGDAANGYPALFGPGVTLGTQIGALPVNVQAALTAGLQQEGYGTAQLTATTTLRQIIVAIATQTAPRTMFGVTV